MWGLVLADMYNQNSSVWQQLNLEFGVKLALVCEATESSSVLLRFGGYQSLISL